MFALHRPALPETRQNLPTKKTYKESGWRNQKVKTAKKKNVTYQYVFRGDKVTFTGETGKEIKYSFKLETASNLKLITIRPEKTLTNSAPVSAAYELDGDSFPQAAT